MTIHMVRCGFVVYRPDIVVLLLLLLLVARRNVWEGRLATQWKVLTHHYIFFCLLIKANCAFMALLCMLLHAFAVQRGPNRRLLSTFRHDVCCARVLFLYSLLFTFFASVLGDYWLLLAFLYYLLPTSGGFMDCIPVLACCCCVAWDGDGLARTLTHWRTRVFAYTLYVHYVDALFCTCGICWVPSADVSVRRREPFDVHAGCCRILLGWDGIVVSALPASHYQLPAEYGSIAVWYSACTPGPFCGSLLCCGENIITTLLTGGQYNRTKLVCNLLG